MLRLLGIVISIGLADSLNPSTVGPALYMATLEHARRRILQFTLGAFCVYLLGGAVIALGPGQLLLALVPHPRPTVSNILEVVAGVALLVGAGLLIWHRERLGGRRLFGSSSRTAAASGRSSFLLGAGIMTFELPTALPYFAAIAAIVGSGHGIVKQTIALVVFNVCFISPLLVMLVVLDVWGERAQSFLIRTRSYIERRWPEILGIAALLAGAFVITLGATGLAENVHGDLGELSRHVHDLLPK